MWSRPWCQHPTGGRVPAREPAGLTPFSAVRRGASIDVMDRARRAEPAGGARPAVWLLLGLGGGLFVVAMVLASLNHTFTGDPFTLLSVAFLGTYAGVGAVLV